MEDTKTRAKIKRIVFTGVLAALLAVLSQISIPTPTGVPITLQTFAVALCGYVMGPTLGTGAVAIYLALGAVGLPVFAGFSGGAGIFLGVTGGYLWGFLPLAFFCGLGSRSVKKVISVLWGVGGLFICHLLGALQFALIGNLSFWEAFLLASAPYLVKDVVSAAAALFGALALRAALKKAGLEAAG